MYSIKIAKLIYTGRGVDNPRETNKMTVNNLERTLEEHLAGKPVSEPLTNPILAAMSNGKARMPIGLPADACDLVFK